MAQTFEAVVEQLQNVNENTNKLVKLTKENERSSITEGTGTILKDDLKEGFNDIIGTITGPLKAIADSVQKTDKLVKLTENISTNTIKTFKENKKETKTVITEGTGTILKDDLKEGFNDIIGTVTGPLKAFADSVPGLGTLGKITKNISSNAIKTFKENRKETKLDKKEHKETVLEQQETQETVEENVALQTPMAAALAEINENTRRMADSLAMQGDPDELTAGEVEKNREEARAQQKQTDVLNQVVENTENLENLPDGKKEKKGGIFGGIIGMFSRFAASIAAIPAMISGVVAAISAFGAALAPLALPIIAVVGGIIAAIGFIKGFMEGFDEGGIFGGLKEGLMKLFDWFIALPLNILKDITVWALNALGMENLASALDAFPLVESLRKMFSFIIDLFVVPIGFVIKTIGGIFGGIFEIIMAPIRAFGTAIMAVFGAIDDIFGGIMMIFSGDIVGGFKAIWDGIKNLIMAPINFVVDTVKGIFGGVFDILMAPFNALKGAIGYIFGPQSALGGVYTFLADMFSGLFDLITLPFRKVWEFVSMIFTDPLAALQSLWNGLTGGVANLLGLITMPIDAAINWVMGLFGFGDPDKPFSLLGLVGDAVGSIWEWFKGLFSFDPSGLMDGLFSIGRIMKGLAKGGWAAVKAMLPGGESPGEAFSRVYNEVTSGGEGKMPTEQMESEEGDMSDPAPTMSADQAAAVKAQMDEIRDRIERSNSGENVYTGPDAIGRSADLIKLKMMEREFSKYNVEEAPTTQTAQAQTETQSVSPEVLSIDDQLAKIQSQREELKEKSESTPKSRRLEQRRIKDADRQLAAQEKKLLEQKSNLTAAEPTYPKKMQYGYVGTSPEKVFFKYNPDGSITVPENQTRAALEYGFIGGEKADVQPVPESSATIQKTNALNKQNMTASEISREYMGAGGNTTVVNAPNNSTNVTGGSRGGSTIIPTSMSDNSSASKAAVVNF